MSSRRSPGQHSNPLQAGPAEALKLAETAPTILPIRMVTAGPEALTLSDSGRGLTQLIGVLHIQDTVNASLGSGNDLTVALNPGETLKSVGPRHRCARADGVWIR